MRSAQVYAALLQEPISYLHQNSRNRQSANGCYPPQKLRTNFDEKVLRQYKHLSASATEILDFDEPSEGFAAGKRVADLSDELIAIEWGRGGILGLGGTADTAKYARSPG